MKDHSQENTWINFSKKYLTKRNAFKWWDTTVTFSYHFSPPVTTLKVFACHNIYYILWMTKCTSLMCLSSKKLMKKSSQCACNVDNDSCIKNSSFPSGINCKFKQLSEWFESQSYRGWIIHHVGLLDCWTIFRPSAQTLFLLFPLSPNTSWLHTCTSRLTLF